MSQTARRTLRSIAAVFAGLLAIFLVARLAPDRPMPHADAVATSQRSCADACRALGSRLEPRSATGGLSRRPPPRPA